MKTLYVGVVTCIRYSDKVEVDYPFIVAANSIDDAGALAVQNMRELFDNMPGRFDQYEYNLTQQVSEDVLAQDERIQSVVRAIVHAELGITQ